MHEPNESPSWSANGHQRHGYVYRGLVPTVSPVRYPLRPATPTGPDDNGAISHVVGRNDRNANRHASVGLAKWYEHTRFWAGIVGLCALTGAIAYGRIKFGG